MTLERGALVNKRYRIVEILGQGGMGSVYRAIDENLGVEVAVKDNLFTTDEYARQFRREATILAALRHPNLPRVTDHFVEENQGQYLVMDYIEGEDLRQRMDRLGTLSEEEVITVGAAICDTLIYLDTRRPPVVHRDIKPGNVRITPEGKIFLVDFGLAKILEISQNTTTGARAMTPGYSPPEQYGTARTDQRSDIFSLGATLYAALTGAIPEDALSRAMDQCELTPIRKHNPRVSRKLASVIEKSLSVRPDDRYQTAEEFKLALLTALSNPAVGRRSQVTGEYIVARPPDPPSQPPPGLELAEGELAANPPGNGNGNPPGSAAIFVTPASRPRPRSRRLGWGCWFTSILLLFLVAGAGYGVLLLRPSAYTSALAMLPPGLLPPAGKPTSTASSVVTAPAALPASTATPTRRATASNTALPVTAAPTEAMIPGTSGTAVPPTATLPPLTPTFSPPPTPLGGSPGIAFASSTADGIQVFTINLDGSGLRQITDMPGGACQPDWSPDGQLLIFISPCEGNYGLYRGTAMFIIHADGTGLIPLETAPGGDFDPAWSPDGQTIAFISLRGSGRPNLFLFHLNDHTVTNLSGSFAADLDPAWSPDGRHIAFATSRRGEVNQIWVMDADGRNQIPLVDSGELSDLHPDWSPDGKTIIYTQQLTDSGIPRLMGINYPPPPPGSGTPVPREFRVSQDPNPMREAHYSPDGYWIIFESWPAGSQHDIYYLASNGAGRKQITVGTRYNFDPVWLPLSATGLATPPPPTATPTP